MTDTHQPQGVMAVDSIQYLFTGEQPGIRTLVGGVLWNFAWFGVPFVIVLGYYLSVIRNTNLNDERINTPPVFTFSNLSAEAVNGLRLLSVLFVYMSTPIIIFYIVLAVSVYTPAAGVNVSEWAITGLIGVAIIMLLSYSIVLYVTPGVVILIAEKQTLWAGFNLKQLGEMCINKAYAMTMLVFVVKSIVFGWVLVTVPVITVGVGVILFLFFVFLYFLHVSYEIGKLKNDVSVNS